MSLSLFGRCAPDLVLRECVAQIGDGNEDCLMKSFLLLQVIAGLGLPEAADYYMSAFTGVLEIAATAPARLSRAAFAVVHTGLENLSVVRTDEHISAMLMVVMRAVQSPDGGIVERALYIGRVVFANIQNSPFLTNFVEATIWQTR
jgi:hypothetical protein